MCSRYSDEFEDGQISGSRRNAAHFHCACHLFRTGHIANKYCTTLLPPLACSAPIVVSVQWDTQGVLCGTADAVRPGNPGLTHSMFVRKAMQTKL
jgi:hypothetical protein